MGKAKIFDVYEVTGQACGATYIVPSAEASMNSWLDFCPAFEEGYRLVQTDKLGNVEAQTPYLDAEERECILWAFHNKRVHRTPSILVKHLKLT